MIDPAPLAKFASVLEVTFCLLVHLLLFSYVVQFLTARGWKLARHWQVAGVLVAAIGISTAHQFGFGLAYGMFPFSNAHILLPCLLALIIVVVDIARPQNMSFERVLSIAAVIVISISAGFGQFMLKQMLYESEINDLSAAHGRVMAGFIGKPGAFETYCDRAGVTCSINVCDASASELTTSAVRNDSLMLSTCQDGRSYELEDQRSVTEITARYQALFHGWMTLILLCWVSLFGVAWLLHLRFAFADRRLTTSPVSADQSA
ncbi:MAG: hypothetical protein KI792_10635 [Alphaproteobacteria bacterium]|nr:hypothetical protein [Alphaproteobacteria bacterium SS10]